MKVGFALGVSLFMATSALAFDLQFGVNGGRRWLEFESRGVQSGEMNLGLQKQITTLPLSVGPSLRLADINNDDLNFAADTAWGYDLAFELKAWIPKENLAGGLFTPYIRYTHDIVSDYTFKGSTDFGSVKSTGEVSGYRFSVGTTYKLQERMNLMAEYSVGSESLKLKTKAEVPPLDDRANALLADAGRLMPGLANIAAARQVPTSFNRTTRSSLDSKAILIGLEVLY